MSELRRTPLSGWHEAHGARMVDFAGYLMPVQYEGVMAEHRAVRRAVGLFDISHMAELALRGPEARSFVDSLVTNNVAQLGVGKALYSALCNESGRVLDDVLVYCLAEDHFLIVANASNRGKVVAWVAARCPAGVEFIDESDGTALMAVQGPASLDCLRAWPRVAPAMAQIEALPYYEAIELKLDGVSFLLSRTGYTGERGYEIYAPAEAALQLWEEILAVGVAHGLRPIGLGARDTLRLEACYCLYGHELDEEHTPYEGGIGWVVRLKAADFVGKDALVAQKADGVRERIVGFHLEGRNIARQGAVVYAGEREVGVVTSGTFSPSLERGIALARIHAEAIDERLHAEIRGRRIPLQRVEIPFVPTRVKD